MYRWRLKWSEVIESGGRSVQVATGENVAHKNQLLAKRVQTLWTEVSARRKVELKWVQGHTGDTGNEAWIHRGGCSMLQLGFSESKRWQGHARPQGRECRFFPSDLIRSLQIGLLMMELQAWSLEIHHVRKISTAFSRIARNVSKSIVEYCGVLRANSTQQFHTMSMLSNIPICL